MTEIGILIMLFSALLYSVFALKKTFIGDCFYISRPDIATLFLYIKYKNLRTLHLHGNGFTKRKLAVEFEKIHSYVVSSENVTYITITTDFFANKIAKDKRLQVLFRRAKPVNKFWKKMFGAKTENAVKIIFIPKKEDLCYSQLS